MKPCGHAEPVEGCRVCHLHATRPDYRALWDDHFHSVEVRCPHLHRRVRDRDGKVKTKWCGTG